MFARGACQNMKGDYIKAIEDYHVALEIDGQNNRKRSRVWRAGSCREESFIGEKKFEEDFVKPNDNEGGFMKLNNSQIVSTNPIPATAVNNNANINNGLKEKNMNRNGVGGLLLSNGIISQCPENLGNNAKADWYIKKYRTIYDKIGNFIGFIHKGLMHVSKETSQLRYRSIQRLLSLILVTLRLFLIEDLLLIN